jgi:hypothetical protein
MIVEMRIYHCAPTRLPALLDRFTSITLGFFEKYGALSKSASGPR